MAWRGFADAIWELFRCFGHAGIFQIALEHFWGLCGAAVRCGGAA
jgi:hypothetical protein